MAYTGQQDSQGRVFVQGYGWMTPDQLQNMVSGGRDPSIEPEGLPSPTITPDPSVNIVTARSPQTWFPPPASPTPSPTATFTPTPTATFTPTPTATFTPTPTPTSPENWFPTPTATPWWIDQSPTPTPTPTPTPVNALWPNYGPPDSPTPSPTDTPSLSPNTVSAGPGLDFVPGDYPATSPSPTPMMAGDPSGAGITPEMLPWNTLSNVPPNEAMLPNYAGNYIPANVPPDETMLPNYAGVYQPDIPAPDITIPPPPTLSAADWSSPQTGLPPAPDIPIPPPPALPDLPADTTTQAPLTGNPFAANIPLPGSSSNLGGGGGAIPDAWGALIGFHDPSFQNWMRANNINPQAMLAILSGSPGMSPGQSGAVGGAVHGGYGPKGGQ